MCDECGFAETLNLSGNQLYGPVPVDRLPSTLWELDVSNNNLTGRISLQTDRPAVVNIASNGISRLAVNPDTKATVKAKDNPGLCVEQLLKPSLNVEIDEDTASCGVLLQNPFLQEKKNCNLW